MGKCCANRRFYGMQSNQQVFLIDAAREQGRCEEEELGKTVQRGQICLSVP
jgi:hypothetical protein